MSALVREAALIAARDLLESSDHKMEEDVENVEDIYLTMEHFKSAVSRVKSSVSTSDRTYYQRMRDEIEK